MEILIKNGIIVDTKNKIHSKMDLLISNGKIAQVAKSSSIGDKDTSGVTVIDATDKIVVPGLIDMHVHFREPGGEGKETLKTCSRAAAMGGITTVVGIPNTNPIADNQTVIEYVVSKAKREGIVNMFPMGAITKGEKGNELAEIMELRNSGAICVTDDGNPVSNSEVMRRAMEYCKMLNMPIVCHNEELSLSADGVMHEGFVSTSLGLPGKPSIAEAVSIGRDIIISEYTGCPVHFTHVSTKESVELIRSAKKKGAKVTADTCPHYFTLTDEAVLGFNPNAKMNPPLRAREHLEAIREGLKDGTIDAIATDHAPHSRVEKYLEFDQCENGIVGLETSVPLVISKLVKENIISLDDAIAKMTINPARILRIDDKKGHLSVGADADVTIIDLNMEETIDSEKFESKGRNTPFGGWKLEGFAVATIVEGRIVMQDRKILVD